MFSEVVTESESPPKGFQNFKTSKNAAQWAACLYLPVYFLPLWGKGQVT